MLDKNQYVKTKIGHDESSDSRISLFSVERRWLSDDDLFADEFKIKIQRIFSLSNLSHDEEIILNDKPLCDDNLLMVHQEAFNRNLLKNSFGTGNESHHKCSSSCEVQSRVDFKECPKFQHWNIVESEGTGWKVTPCFEETEPVPEDVGSSCFTASSRRCAKMQIVSLSDEGLLPELIDRVRPPLEVSEACAANTNNGSIYELKVQYICTLKVKKLMLAKKT